jgi:hypothetical protein
LEIVQITLVRLTCTIFLSSDTRRGEVTNAQSHCPGT